MSTRSTRESSLPEGYFDQFKYKASGESKFTDKLAEIEERYKGVGASGINSSVSSDPSSPMESPSPTVAARKRNKAKHIVLDRCASACAQSDVHRTRI
jgi:hypothetical protein